MKKHLLKFYKKYPQSQIQDFLKIYYLMHLGPGHIINNPVTSINLLREEARMLLLNQDEDLYEFIGENYIKVNLRPYLAFGLGLDDLNDCLVSTSHLEVNYPKFIDSINILKEFLIENYFPRNLVNEELTMFEEDNYPQMHHSLKYKEIYQPSYRIIHKKYLTEEMKYYRLKQFISTLPKDKLNIIAIDGKCASGKTTLAKLFVGEACVIHADDFFDVASNKIGINSERIINEVLNKLEKNSTLVYQRFDCQTKQYKDITLEIKNLVIIEGVYSANRLLAPYYDGIVYLEIDPEEQLNRLQNRSKLLLNRFINEWIPKENHYFKEEEIFFKANIII